MVLDASSSTSERGRRVVSPPGKNATPQSPHQRSSLIRTRELFLFFFFPKEHFTCPLCYRVTRVFFVRIFLFCFVLCVCLSLFCAFVHNGKLFVSQKKRVKKKRGVFVVLAILSVFVVGLFFFFFFFCWCCGIGKRERERERSRYFCVQNVCRVLNTTH